MSKTVREFEFDEQNKKLINFLQEIKNDKIKKGNRVIENPVDDLSSHFPFMVEYYGKKTRAIIVKLLHLLKRVIKNLFFN
jgi:hypothetical protein